jgi:hypothetical protein
MQSAMVRIPRSSQYPLPIQRLLQEVGHDGEADWWTIGRDGVDIEHVRIMSLDWRHDDGIVLVPRLWIAGKAEPRGQNM